MNTENKEINAEENVTTNTLSAKEKIMEDGKMTFWEFLCIARYFLPILTTIGWILIYVSGEQDSTFFAALGLLFVGIGLIAAITVSPIKFIKFIFTSTIKGFYILRSFIPFYGVADLVAAIFGTFCGFLFGVIIVFALPAVFTIAKFFNNNSFKL